MEDTVRRETNGEVARRLRVATELRGLTQTELAGKVSASPASISGWLTGAKQPTRENIRKLGTALNVEPEWLEFGKGEGPQPDARKDREQYLKTVRWAMRPAPTDGGRDYGNSNQEAFDPDLRNLVREGLQNVGDVRIDDTARVVYRLIRLRGKDLEDFKKALRWDILRTHLDAAATVPQRHGRLLKAGLEELDRQKEMLLLVVEDSGTTGLTGDEQGSGNFAALARNNLDSTKTKQTSGGSKGLGKGTWWRCSLPFVVLMNTDLAEPTSSGHMDCRIIGRAELPWHEHQGRMCAGPGWFGIAEQVKDIEIAVSCWGNRTLAKDLHIERDPQRGPGTTICVVGFYDPSSDVPKDTRTLADDLEKAVAEYFWPAICDNRLSVRIETYDGRELKTFVDVDPASDKHVPQLVDALKKYRADELSENLEQPGSVVARKIRLLVPKRIGDGQHPACEHEAVLIVRRASDEDLENGEDEHRNQMALMRGPRMVVRYEELRTIFSGAIPFHAALLCGEAATAKPNSEDTKADRFLRTAEPPAHDRWDVTPELRTDYAKGYKKAIDDLLKLAVGELLKLVKPRVDYLDDGPNALKELLKLSEPGPPVDERPRIYRASAMVDQEGRWVVDARVKVKPGDSGWRVRPVVLFVGDNGRNVPVDWLELDAVNQCVRDGETHLVLEPGVAEARFKGITDPQSHPVSATESGIRIDLREVSRTEGGSEE